MCVYAFYFLHIFSDNKTALSTFLFVAAATALRVSFTWLPFSY